jgi:thioredoxin 2
MSELRHIVCPHCDSVNRVPRDKPAAQAKCGRCHKPLFTSHPTPVTAKSFDAHLKWNDIPVVVDFWAEWCGPCKMMAPVYDRLAGEFEPEVRFLKVDTEREQALAGRYAIQSIPMLVLFKKATVAAQRAGAVNAETLRAWLRQHAGVGAAARQAS